MTISLTADLNAKRSAVSMGDEGGWRVDILFYTCNFGNFRHLIFE